ncbi:hypothetical protein [Streptomyces sp. URMC 123]|uniref:hypothetical protein n=1 Tax=Streptomyces sp. URMC 123 TaxID=3423403 RepID=UPI003F1BBB30
MPHERHVVTDAHGRPTDLASNAPVAHSCGCGCSKSAAPLMPRGWREAAIPAAAILSAFLIVLVLLLVVRDILVAVVSSIPSGLFLAGLSVLAGRRAR